MEAKPGEVLPESVLAWAATLEGQRLEDTWFAPATGLLCLCFWQSEKHYLACGLGPKADRVWHFARPPTRRATAAHPLIASLRAHVEGHRVRAVSWLSPGVLALELGAEALGIRLVLAPGRHGALWIRDAAGKQLQVWPLGATELPEAFAGELRAWEQFPGDPELQWTTHEGQQRELLRTAWLRAGTKRAAGLLRRADAVRVDLSRLDNVATLQKYGRLLLAQGAQIPRGARAWTLEDWEAGGDLQLTLDPALSVKEQAQKYFEKARRLQRGERFMRRRLEDTEQQWEAVANWLARVQSSTLEGTSVEALRKEAEQLGFGGELSVEPKPGGRVGQSSATRRPYVGYRDALGKTVLVGRGGADNDAVLSRFARPHDLWLHVKDKPGAHVIVPLEKGQNCPAERLLDAATLAVHHSDARGESVCEVSYVERRYVRKPKGAAPGAVRFDHEKVLVLRMEPERLERLLASREEG